LAAGWLAPIVSGDWLSGLVDLAFVITLRLPLAQAPEAQKTCRGKQDGCIKVVLTL
jgi:threonine dehydrogenase-like Zn-dependent dehydrogenase